MFRGSVVALITPFTAEGDVDFPAFCELIDWHANEGTDAIVCCGTTGEAPTLSCEEKDQIFKTAVEVSRGRVPIIAGTGTYDTRKTVAATARAKELGVEGCLVVVPYYNRPTPEGCIAHYQAINTVGLPTILYHHPGRTGVKLSAEVLAEISRLPSIVAIKEASGGLELMQEIQKLSDIPIFSGDDTLALAMMELGAVGVISIVANLIPRAWKEMIGSFLQGDFKRAQELNAFYAPLVEAMVLETNPQCVKCAASLLGKCQPQLRLPLVFPRSSTQQTIASALARTGLYDSESAKGSCDHR